MGVAIAIRKDWKHKIQDYTWISDRIIETRIKVLNRNLTIVGVYAPAEGKEQDTEGFYRELQQSIDNIPKKENIILAGDFNGRMGTEEKRGTTFRSSTDEIFETLIWNNKTR